MRPLLVDSNVILDIATIDPVWLGWSEAMLERLANEASLVINPLIYADVAVLYRSLDDLEAAMPRDYFRRDPLTYDAAFLAGRAFRMYRRRGGTRTSPMPDFYIGAHAAVCRYRLLTRDAARYRTYFSTVELIAP